MKIKISNSNVPAWKDVTVKSRIPAELKKLELLILIFMSLIIIIINN